MCGLFSLIFCWNLKNYVLNFQGRNFSIEPSDLIFDYVSNIFCVHIYLLSTWFVSPKKSELKSPITTFLNIFLVSTFISALWGLLICYLELIYFLDMHFEFYTLHYKVSSYLNQSGEIGLNFTLFNKIVTSAFFMFAPSFYAFVHHFIYWINERIYLSHFIFRHIFCILQAAEFFF